MARGEWPEDKKLPGEKRHKCRTVSISDQNYKTIKELGHDNFSNGIRKLLDLFVAKEQKND